MASGDREQHSFELNGRTYRSLDEVPPPFRDSILALMADHDGNGIPDIFEGDAEHLRVMHRSVETYEVDGTQYSSIDDVPEPHRTALRQAIGRVGEFEAGAITPNTQAPNRRDQASRSAPAQPQPIVSSAHSSRRTRLLAAFIAVDTIVVAAIVWFVLR